MRAPESQHGLEAPCFLIDLFWHPGCCSARSGGPTSTLTVRHKGNRDMRSNAIRAWVVLATILSPPWTALVAQETASLSIGQQVGETGVIHAQAQEQSPSPSEQLFSLRNGVTIHLSGDWGPDPYDRTPTPPALNHQAPRE